MARAVIADPDLPHKARTGKVPRPCVGVNDCLHRTMVDGMRFSCAVNPQAGHELAEIAAGRTAAGARRWRRPGGPGGRGTRSRARPRRDPVGARGRARQASSAIAARSSSTTPASPTTSPTRPPGSELARWRVCRNPVHSCSPTCCTPRGGDARRGSARRGGARRRARRARPRGDRRGRDRVRRGRRGARDRGAGARARRGRARGGAARRGARASPRRRRGSSSSATSCAARRPARASCSPSARTTPRRCSGRQPSPSAASQLNDRLPRPAARAGSSAATASAATSSRCSKTGARFATHAAARRGSTPPLTADVYAGTRTEHDVDTVVLAYGGTPRTELHDALNGRVRELQDTSATRGRQDGCYQSPRGRPSNSRRQL